MNVLNVENYNLPVALIGGQSFVWEFDDGWFYGATQDKAIKLKQEGDKIFWQTFPENNDEQFIKDYLRLGADYNSIISKINKDSYVDSAIQKYPNLRLLKQDFSVGLLSFLLSPQKAIPLIRRSVFAMKKELGEKVDADGKDVYLFPKTEIIAETPLEKLLSFGIGYRAKSLKSTAKYLIDSGLAGEIEKMAEPEARIELKKIKGVGDKIADCVLTYSLGYDHVTPLDVWGMRIMTQYYNLDPKTKYEDMRKWIIDYFDGFAAWGGQFLFEYIRGFDPETSV